MSYISGSFTGSDQMVISFWFRIPGSTIDAIKQEYQPFKDALEEGNLLDRRRFLGIIPLMTFGPTLLESKKIYMKSRETGSYSHAFHTWSDGGGYPLCNGAGWQITPTPGGTFDAYYFTFDEGEFHAGGGYPLDGSYIGVDCTGENPALSVNLVMPFENTASYIGGYPVVKSQDTSGTFIDYAGGGACAGSPGRHFDPVYGLCYEEIMNTVNTTVTYESNADVILGGCPETFRLLPAKGGSIGGVASEDLASSSYPGRSVSPDHWHHLLLSFDLTPGVATQGQMNEFVRDQDASRVTSMISMWVAFDNQNLTGNKLSVYHPKDHDNENGIVSVNGFTMLRQLTHSATTPMGPGAACQATDGSTESIQQIPEYNFLPGPIDGSNFGVPASGDNVEAIRHCEMAELQIFSGICLDTGDSQVREAFISKGKPTPPDKKSTPANPVSGSFEYINGVLSERDPLRPIIDRDQPTQLEVLFHGARKWIKGQNAGSSGTFDPTGQIDPYRPDPSLGGPQGESQ